MPSNVRVIEAKPFDDLFKDLTSALSSLDEHKFQVAAIHVATAIEALEREISLGSGDRLAD